MWDGPEYKLDGKDCWYCPYEPPVIKLSNVAVCFTCLCRAFPGLDDAQVSGWLVKQTERRIAIARAREGREERDMAALKEWLNS